MNTLHNSVASNKYYENAHSIESLKREEKGLENEVLQNGLENGLKDAGLEFRNDGGKISFQFLYAKKQALFYNTKKQNINIHFCQNNPGEYEISLQDKEQKNPTIIIYKQGTTNISDIYKQIINYIDQQTHENINEYNTTNASNNAWNKVQGKAKIMAGWIINNIQKPKVDAIEKKSDGEIVLPITRKGQQYKFNIITLNHKKAINILGVTIKKGEMSYTITLDNTQKTLKWEKKTNGSSINFCEQIREIINNKISENISEQDKYQLFYPKLIRAYKMLHTEK